MTLLTVERLSKSFGGVQAVREVSFTLERGQLLALIGPNGAGKSTCFNMLNGQLDPDSGTVSLAGEDITGHPPREIWKRGVGRTFQVAATYGSMTVCENVQMVLSVAWPAAVRLVVPGRRALSRRSARAAAAGRDGATGRTSLRPAGIR